MAQIQLQLRTRPQVDGTSCSAAACKPGARIDGHGRAIVLLHSSMGSKSQWQALTDRMRHTHRLIAIDLHGYGDSAMPVRRDGFSLGDEVSLVEAVVQETLAPGERFHLAGHSYGGAVALRLAYSCPERVLSLSLFEPAAFHLLPGGHCALVEIRAVENAMKADLVKGDMHAAMARFIDYWSGPGAFAALPAEKRAVLFRVLEKVPLDFHAAVNEPLKAADYRRLAMPARLIAGRYSPRSVHWVLATLSVVLPNHQLHGVNAGHMAPLTHPDLVNPIIEGLIREVDGLLTSSTKGRTRDGGKAISQAVSC